MDRLLMAVVVGMGTGDCHRILRPGRMEVRLVHLVPGEEGAMGGLRRILDMGAHTGDEC